MTTRIAKWGNGLGLRLSTAILKEARLDEGDKIDVSVRNGAIVIRSGRSAYTLGALVSKITPKNRPNQDGWRSPAD